MKFLNKIFGDPNVKYLKKLQPRVEQINELEKKTEAFSDEELKSQTEKLKERLEKGEDINNLVVDSFAVVREAAKRTLEQRHYDVQLLSGMVLHYGEIAEMKTGEGKTLSATLPLYLNALQGKGAHCVTVNDYLARRDCGWMGPIYHALGMTAGVIMHAQAFVYDPEYVDENHTDERLKHLKPVSRKEAYEADITYGTNNEYGFDYLRDNMVQDNDQKVQRELHFAIVDEVDSILIDEARTPLIISAPDTESTSKYQQFAQMVTQLKENEDYNVDEKMRAATLTDEGIAKIEKMLGVENIYTERGVSEVHHIEQALRAWAVYKKDKDYVVREGEVVIIDEFTGRMMAGRRYSEGLHQAIEAKEGVEVKRESRTMATITFQNYFRLYEKLAGMTGTAETEAEEFAKIYGLDVTVVPTNKEIQRLDLPDRIYKSEKGKIVAIAREVKERTEKGQPVLIGTISIEKNEMMAEALRKEGIQANVLNAKNHEKEADFVSQAGKPGVVTIATNMAGRGVDIKLGGDPADPELEKQVKEAGGLMIIGTERHESRRIDNQLRGRAGRQGDPGTSQFYVSLDDDLMRIFGTDRIKGVMERLKVPEDMPIENKMISRSLEAAQKKVEGYHFDTRKRVVEYDDVVNKQRETIYRRRQETVAGENTKNAVMELVLAEITDVVMFHTADEEEKRWNLEEIYEVVNTMFHIPTEARLKVDDIADEAGNDIEDKTARGKIIGYLYSKAVDSYNELEKRITESLGQEEAMRNIEKSFLLRAIDTLWVEHLEALDHLRTGIGLRGYGQRDPLIEFKREGFQLFKELLIQIQKQVVYGIYKIGVSTEFAPGVFQRVPGMTLSAPSKTMGEGGSSIAKIANQAGQPTAQQKEVAQARQELPSEDRTHFDGEKVGRNDPCPCDSGKKFKQCHGK